MYRNMAFFRNKLLFCLLLFCLTPLVFSHSVSRHYTPPSVTPLTNLFTHVLIDEGFSTFFGGSNIKIINNGSMAAIALDKSSGKILCLSLFHQLTQLFQTHICFFRLWINLPERLSLRILQCRNKVAGRNLLWSCTGILCKLFLVVLTCRIC